MSEVDTTQWYLPGVREMPRAALRVQLEVHGETILLRGFENDSDWVRTVLPDGIASGAHPEPGVLLCYRRCENERNRLDGIDQPECRGIIHQVFVEVLDRLC